MKAVGPPNVRLAVHLRGTDYYGSRGGFVPERIGSTIPDVSGDRRSPVAKCETFSKPRGFNSLAPYNAKRDKTGNLVRSNKNTGSDNLEPQ